MSDGEPHPSARVKVLSYTFALGEAGTCWLLEPSITSSRLALLGGVPSESLVRLVIWNWITGEMLLVCQLFVGNHTLMHVLSI